MFGCFDWFGLVLRNICIKEKVRFQRSYCHMFFQKPCSCFGYRLSYNNPNRVILIGKEQ